MLLMIEAESMAECGVPGWLTRLVFSLIYDLDTPLYDTLLIVLPLHYRSDFLGPGIRIPVITLELASFPTN